MERATRHPVRALLLELHVLLNDPDDVCLSFEIVDECLGVTHYLKIRMRVRSTIAVRLRYFSKSALRIKASTILVTARAPCLVGRKTTTPPCFRGGYVFRFRKSVSSVNKIRPCSEASCKSSLSVDRVNPSSNAVSTSC